MKLNTEDVGTAHGASAQGARPSAPDDAEAQALPHHLVPLPGEEWALWRWVGLRGAGFPAGRVLTLGSPALAAAADQLLLAEQEARGARDQLLDKVRGLLDKLKRDNEWEDEAKRKPLLSALRDLNKGKPPAPAGDADDELRPLAERLRSADARLGDTLSEARRAFEASSDGVTVAIQEAVRDERFQEAIIWQNRHAYHTAVLPLLQNRSEPSRGTKQRQRERLIASYLQRYCLKNDTIGFFGPVGWARIAPENDAVEAYPGDSLLSVRNLYYEVWCIDALAGALSKNHSLHKWLAPMRAPLDYLEGAWLHMPFKSPLKVSTEQALVLRKCDGEKTAQDVAAELIAAHPHLFRDEQAVFETLETLRSKGGITWRLEVPMEVYPERTLRKVLGRIDDEACRASTLAALDELDASRAAVAAAAGDVEKLDEAFGNLAGIFTRLTGASSMKSEGKTYAARTLLYEDCQRNIEVKIGKQILSDLSPPLSLLLTSARWFTYQVASSYRKALVELHAELVRKSKRPALDFVSFWYYAKSRVFKEENTPVDVAVAELQRRWADILSIPHEQSGVSYGVEELRPKVAEAFAAPRAGWKMARYHSPDVMIAASSVEDFRRGAYQLVLGELHVAANSLGCHIFMQQHPSPDELVRAYESDIPGPHLIPILAKNQILQSARLLPALISENDYRLVLVPELCDMAHERVVAVGEFLVERDGEGLSARTRDGRLRFDFIEAISTILMSWVLSRFKPFPARAHTPRISFDGLVVSRESWCFSPAELPFALEAKEFERFLAVRRWARSHNMPRFVFVKSSAEVKPFYVDFDSQIYVDLFAKAIRQATEADAEGAAIAVSEMLPRHDQTWLPDADGNLYTCELRVAALDLAV